MDDDPFDDLRAVGMTAGASLSRVAETLMRHSQEQSRQRQQATQQATEEAQRRVTAQAGIAEAHFKIAADPRWADKATPSEQGQTWKAAQQWKDIDSERFGAYADQLTKNVSDRYGARVGETVDRLGVDGRDLSADLIELGARRRNEAGDELGQAAGDKDEVDRKKDQAGREREDRNEDRDPADKDRDEDLMQDSTEQARQAGDRSETREDRADNLDDQAAANDGDAQQDPTEAPYDTPARRTADEQAMKDAGVPVKAREAKIVADHGNATNPANAAKTGSKQKSQGRTTAGTTGRKRQPARGR